MVYLKYTVRGHEYTNEVYSILQSFYTSEEHQVIQEISKDDICIESYLGDEKCGAILYSSLKVQNYFEISLHDVSEKEYARNVKLAVYHLLSNITNIKNEWGILTGVRPLKKIGQLFDDGLTENEILLYMEKNYAVSIEKSKFCIEVYKKEIDILKNNNGENYAVYIGIPFCPTRCLYCSFTSYLIDDYKNKVGNYLQCIQKEMIETYKYFKNKKVESIYIGGGTPTSLSHEQLSALLSGVFDIFKDQNIKELTVEAGRPDTITREKLEVLKKYNARISINPQTMNSETLVKIGREHTVEDFINSFYLARELGFDNINVDLILGLPDETPDDVLNTFKEIIKLSPESITVHTLAIKRASRLKENLSNYSFTKPKEMQEMQQIAKKYTEKINMKPYYLYRQKNMVGNYENVGYCKNGFECIYNIQIMEEKQTVLAFGAGATTKIVDFCNSKINRCFNVKNVDEYLNRIDEMIERKIQSIKGENL